jgi:hypothetical protein
VLQVFPLTLLEVNVTLSPWQNVNGPLALIVGVAGFEFTVTIAVAGNELQLPLLIIKV